MTTIKRGNLFALLFFCYSKKPYLTDLPFVRGSTKGKSVLPYRTKNATHTLSHTQKYMLPNITPKISSPPSLIDVRRVSIVPHQKRRTFPSSIRKTPHALYRSTRKKPVACAPHRVKNLVFSLLCTLLNSTHKKARRVRSASRKKISSSPFFAPHTKKPTGISRQALCNISPNLHPGGQTSANRCYLE